ncbi:bifunctional biotin--[acetyl-CoA-carboxylase] ligase/biotin operon repressor BirA [Catenovulum sp. SM1970]|uniref:bifunctional biotin--[acetyl-CoA-carboxylase] ligase/biotin operon repressor BirA n=1 Tax=Marinifaba aquimaris TaxID=2741323 RepID=UPI0015745D3B|nr:bifunctional biotin--[acetyl-CoA-carboxylase] ligase/biotin operon repressor BirA [Marinifaba aquimaris]NTS78733.1 bifunctional biotin--[acetyl-CoA-carboxylase] ligase/biotin operon repressor BirA [Marinifaba aquimaris]
MNQTQLNDNLLSLLSLLAGNDFHSGDKLASVLKVSRAAVSKRVAKLNELGIEVHSVKGKGYQLSPLIDLYDVEQITAALSNRFHITHTTQTASTNDDAKKLLADNNDNTHWHLVLTEQQNAGRGRRGRSWVSSFAQNLAISLGLSLDIPVSQLSGLSIAVGLSLAKSLNELGYPAQLKWPNDIYLNGEKLAGILLELEGAFDANCNVIVGIGINVNMPANNQDAKAQIEQAWTSLYQYSGKSINRSQLLITLIERLAKDLEHFIKYGLVGQEKTWQNYDRFYNQPIQLLMPNKTICGVGKGINQEGALLLQTEQGLETFIGGEISVRGQQSE